MKVEYLFVEPKIFIVRGSTHMEAVRKKEGYVYSTGPLKGQRVTILLFDRLGISEFTDSLHIDLLPIQLSFGTKKIFPISITENKVIADVFIEKETKRVLFKRNKEVLELDCGHLEPHDNSGMQNLKRAIVKMVDERMPFDEPLHEYGLQLDGRLRAKWQSAYLTKKYVYTFNGDKYRVFDYKGNPIVPEVCVDFLVDSMDRAAGSWFNPQSEKRKRTVGTFDSKSFNQDYILRNVTGFTKFVEDHPQWFEVTHFKDKIELSSEDFYKSLPDKDLITGDIVFIKGETPWDKVEEHAHSFFIFENDPVTGLPITIAGNAGPASLRSWEIERKRTPERYIFMKVRLKNEFLKLLAQDKNIQKDPVLVR